MSKKKSLEKLYGWIIENLEDNSKKDTQFVPKLEDINNDMGRGYDIEYYKPINRILYKYNGRSNHGRMYGSKNKVSISYHKSKRRKRYFGSKTTTKKYYSKGSQKKYYGNNDRNYYADINIKNIKKTYIDKKIKISKN